MQFSALPVARRLRWIALPKIVIGGYLAFFYRWLGLRFEYVPLLSLPVLAAAGYFLYTGPVWLGVLLAWFHTANDVADGVTMGLEVNRLPDAAKPRARMRLRRILDTYVVDVSARVVLYMVLVLKLGELKLVHPMMLMTLIVMEIVVLSITFDSELNARRSEFHYEFVLEPGAGRRLFGVTYPLQVVTGQMTAYNFYSLLPLIGYLLPLGIWGRAFFYAIFVARAFTLAWRMKAITASLSRA